MQINSVNKQDNFGLRFSPIAAATIRGTYTMQEIAQKANLIKTTVPQESIQRLTRSIKRMFPNATLDIKTIRGEDPLVSAEGFWRKFSQRANRESQDIVNELIVLKRNGMPDETIITNPMYKRHPLKNILATLKRIQKREQ